MINHLTQGICNMGCRLNDIAGIVADLNTVPEAVWASSPHQAFQADTAPAVFHTQGSTSIFAGFDRDGSGRASN